MKFINLTDHQIDYYDNNNIKHSIPKGDKNYRVRFKQRLHHQENDVNFMTLESIDRNNELPCEKGTYYIVSRLIKELHPTRTDIICPGEPKIDESGNRIGCIGFTCLLK